MVQIEEILQLPKEQQIAIVDAIQDKLDDFEDETDALSDDHINFIKERIRIIETTSQPTYTWQQMKEQLKTRWDMR